MSFPDAEALLDLLSLGLREESWMRQASPLLSVHEIEDPLARWLWELMNEVWLTDKVVLPREVLGARACQDYPEEEEREAIQRYVKALYRRNPKTPKNSLSCLQKVVTTHVLASTATNVVRRIESGDLEEARQLMAEGLRQTARATSSEGPSAWQKEAKGRIARYAKPVSRPRIALPLPSLTRMTNGGPGSGDSCLIVATTHVGKSSYAVDTGYAALTKSKAVVLHISTEETKEVIEARYDARLSGIDRGVLMSGALNERELQILEMQFGRRGKARDIGNRLLVLELCAGASFLEVISAAQQAREEWPEKHLVVIVDTQDDLEPTEKQESTRLRHTKLSLEMKALAGSPDLRPCTTWGTVQATREREGKRIRMRDVSESYDKARKTDLMISISEPAGFSTNGDGRKQVEVGLNKNRLGSAKNVVIQAKADFGTCTFEETVSYEEEKDD